MTEVLAVMAAVGVFLVVDALAPRRPRVRLTAPDPRPLGQRLMEAFFAPAAERVAALGRGDLGPKKADLSVRLARAGYPPPFSSPEAVIAYRLFTAVLFAALGGAFALLVGLGAAALPMMLGLAALGWLVPDRAIANAERERREQLILDAASALDRLAIYVAAGHALPAAVRSMAERPGGAWVAELRKIAADYAVTGDFPGALEQAIERNGRLPEIARVCERLRAAYEMGGGGVAQSLRRMAQDARHTIRLLIAERGYRNAVYMVIPAFFAIIAIAVILIGPGAVRMLAVLGG
ncbi:MAG: type II secretion system F family protein [Armatimonadota bacterium]|nr:type II secretion system F family protein [Armatimonadota bacterium]